MLSEEKVLFLKESFVIVYEFKTFHDFLAFESSSTTIVNIFLYAFASSADHYSVRLHAKQKENDLSQF